MSHHLDNYIGFRILQVQKAHRSHAEDALNKLGLYTGQELLLFQLWKEEGLTQSQLVEKLGVEPPTITKTLQRLERSGLVVRRQDSVDARVSRVYLTEEGRALQGPVQKVWEELEARTVKGLSDIEQALMLRLLGQILTNLAD